MVNEAQIKQKLEEINQDFEKFLETPENKDLTKEQCEALFILRRLAEIDILINNLQEYAQK